jgi:hypothetical protein
MAGLEGLLVYEELEPGHLYNAFARSKSFETVLGVAFDQQFKHQLFKLSLDKDRRLYYGEIIQATSLEPIGKIILRYVPCFTEP